MTWSSAGVSTVPAVIPNAVLLGCAVDTEDDYLQCATRHLSLFSGFRSLARSRCKQVEHLSLDGLCVYWEGDCLNRLAGQLMLVIVAALTVMLLVAMCFDMRNTHWPVGFLLIAPEPNPDTNEVEIYISQSCLFCGKCSLQACDTLSCGMVYFILDPLIENMDRARELVNKAREFVKQARELVKKLQLLQLLWR